MIQFYVRMEYIEKNVQNLTDALMISLYSVLMDIAFHLWQNVQDFLLVYHRTTHLGVLTEVVSRNYQIANLL